LKKDTAMIKKLLVVAIMLAVVTISIIAFIGVYTKNLNKLSNIIPNYKFGMEFNGNREYEYLLDQSEKSTDVYVDANGKVSGEVVKDTNSASADLNVSLESENGEVESNTESKGTDIEGYTQETRTIKANEDDVLSLNSYNQSKKVMEERLEEAGVSEYYVKLDEVNGKIVLEIPDDEDSAFIQELVSSQGKFSVIDSQTGLELMNNEQLKKATVEYGNVGNGYTVYLQLQFNNEGKEKLSEISKKYVQRTVLKEDTSESATDTSEDNTETKIDYIEIKIDDSRIMKTYFAEELTGGIMQIPLASNVTEADSLKNNLKSANAIANILNSGKMQNKYELKNDDFIKSSITEKDINTIQLTFACVIGIVSLMLIIKFKANGLIGAILNLGYLATLSLAIRYTNVVITVSSGVTAFLVIGINFKFMNILLSELKSGRLASDSFKIAMRKIFLSIIPVCIIGFVFAFMQSATIVGIGMVIFWAVIVNVIFNNVFTRNVYELIEK